MTGSILQAVNVFSSSQSTGGTIVGHDPGQFIGNQASNSRRGSGISATIQGQTDATLLIDNNTITRPMAMGAASMWVSRAGESACGHAWTRTPSSATSPSPTTPSLQASAVGYPRWATIVVEAGQPVSCRQQGADSPRRHSRERRADNSAFAIFTAHIIFSNMTAQPAHGIGQLVDTAPASANPTASCEHQHRHRRRPTIGIALDLPVRSTRHRRFRRRCWPIR